MMNSLKVFKTHAKMLAKSADFTCLLKKTLLRNIEWSVLIHFMFFQTIQIWLKSREKIVQENREKNCKKNVIKIVKIKDVKKL